MILTRLVVKIAKPLGVRWLMTFFREVAEGKRGETWQRLYWRAQGMKAWTGFAFACLTGTAYLAEADPRVIAAFGSVAALATVLGFVDKAWRTTRPDWLTDSTVYRILASAPAELAGAFGGAYAWAATNCTLGDPWCVLVQWLILFLAAASIQLGLLDAAWRAPGPFVNMIQVRRLKGL